MDAPWVYALWGVGAYLIGSVPIGDVVTRRAGAPIRELGTGNPGAANVFREVGPVYAAAVLLLDLAKGLAVTLPVYLLDLQAWAALTGTAGVLAGHFFPLFRRFQGGTGMVTAMGAAFGLIPAGALIAAPFTLIFLRLWKNAAYAGALFFALAALAGWMIHQDIPRAAIVLGGAAAVLVKSLTQYR